MSEYRWERSIREEHSVIQKKGGDLLEECSAGGMGLCFKCMSSTQHPHLPQGIPTNTSLGKQSWYSCIPDTPCPFLCFNVPHSTVTIELITSVTSPLLPVRQLAYKLPECRQSFLSYWQLYLQSLEQGLMQSEHSINIYQRNGWILPVSWELFAHQGSIQTPSSFVLCVMSLKHVRLL